MRPCRVAQDLCLHSSTDWTCFQVRALVSCSSSDSFIVVSVTHVFTRNSTNVGNAQVHRSVFAALSNAENRK